MKMKALSIKQPFADFILSGQKTIEVRSWSTEYCGEVLVCSSARPTYRCRLSGYAIGIIELVGCHELFAKDTADFEAACISYAGLDPDKQYYGWYLRNPRWIKPFPVKGKLGFFEVECKKNATNKSIHRRN